MDISDDWKTAAAKHGNSDQKDRHLNTFDKRQNSAGCSFVTGVGKVFNDLFYVGGEAFVDIGSFKKQTQKSKFDFYKVTLGDDDSAVYSKDLKSYDTVDTKSRDINFAIVGRFGNYIESIDSLICLRAGCALLETSFKAQRLDRSVDCEIAPLVGIDFEKSFSSQETNNWMIRVSVDYCFPFSKKENCIRYDPMLRKDACNTRCKAKMSGYTFRIMYLYNFGL